MDKRLTDAAFTGGYEQKSWDSVMLDVLLPMTEDIDTEESRELLKHYAQGVLQFKKRNWVKGYTDAPASYDSWGTVSALICKVEIYGSRKELRRVYIDPQHLEWHKSRYASGLYFFQPDFSQLARWPMQLDTKTADRDEIDLVWDADEARENAAEARKA